MVDPLTPYKGRGAPVNTPNRFEKASVERDESWDEDDPAPLTQFFKDRTRSVIATNDSPDLGFGASINPYRGCEHGCIYCYARPTHEYLGLSAGLDFESKIFVKEKAPELLREALLSPKWKPQMLMMSGVTDCYQPVERRLQLTRRCLQVLAEFRNPVGVITKNQLVTRDIDVLSELASVQAAHVTLSVTSLRQELAQHLEPRTSMPKARVDAIRALASAGISVGVNIAPVIPGLNDHEIPAILSACREAGALSAGYVLLRLPYAVSPLFQKWLEVHAPESKEKVLHRIREVRGGKLYDSRFKIRQKGEGVYAEQIKNLFTISRRKVGYPTSTPELSTAAFRRPQGPQIEWNF
jgi:DNA repair photolyase